jgi:hypothetical protein
MSSVDYYTDECPICKGVMLPEKVEKLEIQVKDLEKRLKIAENAADQWRDLYKTRLIA